MSRPGAGLPAWSGLVDEDALDGAAAVLAPLSAGRPTAGPAPAPSAESAQPAPSPTPTGQPTEEPSEEPSGTVSDAIAIGDLDDDGMHDVLIATWDLAADTGTLTAASGVDGTTLWSAGDQPGWVAAHGTDLTGDGVEDLLEVRTTDHHQGDEECNGDACTQEESWRARVAVRSGVDGTEAWSYEWDGRRTIHGDGADRVSRTEQGRLSSLEVSGDAIVLGRSDVQASSHTTRTDTVPVLLGSSTTTDALEEQIHVMVLDAATGTVTATWHDEGTGYANAQVVGDGVLIGRETRPTEQRTCPTGLLGVGPCTTEGDPTAFTLSSHALDGTTRWSLQVEAQFGYAGTVGGDVDGDGTEDLTRIHYGPDDTVNRTLLSGSTGEVTFTDDSAWYWLEAIDDVDGDGIADVLAIEEGPNGELVLRRLRADGTELARTHHRGPHADDPEAFEHAWVQVAPHGDGCAAQVGWRTSTFDDEGSDSAESATFHREPCAGGSELWRTTVDGGGSWHTADVDGDAIADVLTGTAWWLDDEVLEATVLDGRTGEALWHRTASGHYGYSTILGVGLVAMVYDTTGEENRTHTVIDVLDADGELRWTHRSDS